MASITLGGNPINTAGELPKVGTKLADFKLVKNDLSVASVCRLGPRTGYRGAIASDTACWGAYALVG